MTTPAQTPLRAVIDRLAWEAQYLRDVLHLAGDGGVCRISSLSAARIFEGISLSISALRQIEQSMVGQVPPVAGAAGGAAPATQQGG